MNATKHKILITSLRLFNDRGISDVSLRTIADAAKISVGNLQYHFKKREDIVEALYFQLVEKIDAIAIMNSDSLLASFLSISKAMISILFEYHFFLLDFPTITRRNQTIKLHYAALSKRRAQAILGFVDVLIEHGLFRPEVLKNEYLHLYKRTEVLSNFWFSSVLIEGEVLSEECVEDYVLVVRQSIYPYLTEEGKLEYGRIFLA